MDYSKGATWCLGGGDYAYMDKSSDATWHLGGRISTQVGGA